MSDLIMRDEALKAIVDERTHTLLQAWINIKNTVPPVDAVEVVRCKECRYCKMKHGTFKGEPIIFYRCEENNRDVESDDYCSFGERSNK